MWLTGRRCRKYPPVRGQRSVNHTNAFKKIEFTQRPAEEERPPTQATVASWLARRLHGAPRSRPAGHHNHCAHASNSHAHHFLLFTSLGCSSFSRSLRILQPVSSTRAPQEKDSTVSDTDQVLRFRSAGLEHVPKLFGNFFRCSVDLCRTQLNFEASFHRAPPR